MAKVVLDRPGVLPIVRKFVAAAMAQRVAVNEERESGSLTSTGNHALIPGHGQGS
jgi:hypothetical protein